MELGPFGLSEVLFIALLALIVFGPRRLPEIGHAVGRLTTKLRRATQDLKRAWESELDEESRESMRDAARQLRRVKDDLASVGREAWREGGAVAGAAREAESEAGRALDDARSAVLPRSTPGPAATAPPPSVSPPPAASPPPVSEPRHDP